MTDANDHNHILKRTDALRHFMKISNNADLVKNSKTCFEKKSFIQKSKEIKKVRKNQVKIYTKVMITSKPNARSCRIFLEKLSGFLLCDLSFVAKIYFFEFFEKMSNFFQ